MDVFIDLELFMSHYSVEFKQNAVQDFKDVWASDQSVSLQSYATNQLRVHHTTFRQWVKEFDPDLRESLRNHRHRKSQQQTIDLDKQPESGLKVVTEQYQYDKETTYHPVQADSGHDSLVDQLKDRVEQLENENSFLRKCVAYWTHQAMPQEMVI